MCMCVKHELWERTEHKLYYEMTLQDKKTSYVWFNHHSLKENIIIKKKRSMESQCKPPHKHHDPSLQ